MKLKFPFFSTKILNLFKVKANYIFVDYFDTVAFRHIHSDQVFPQWAKLLLNKFPELQKKTTINNLVRQRNKLISSGFNAEESYKNIFEEWSSHIDIDEADFCSFCSEADLAVEIGCQYPNVGMVSFLRKQKEKGKKIFLVSDFHLPGKAYDIFLQQLNITDLFDKVFISDDLKKTKHQGEIYTHILKQENIEATDVLMIGDSIHSDVRSAQKNGLHARWYFPLHHKLWTNFSKRTNFKYDVFSKKGKQLLKDSYFGEYAIPLFAFCHALPGAMNRFNLKKANFLSRGGWMMKNCFDIYQKLVIENSRLLTTSYLKNSRKVCFKALSDYREGLGCKVTEEYINRFCEKDGSLCIIDEGWYNHSQQALVECLRKDIYGFYIGSCRKEILNLPNLCSRNGLLFEIKDEGGHTPYYWVLSTNRALYEQLFTTRDGSVKEYLQNTDGEIEVVETDDEREIFVYDKYIQSIQSYMLNAFKGITAWSVGGKAVNKKSIAYLMLASALQNSKERSKILRELDANRVDNASEGKRAADKNIKDLNLNIIKLLIHPDEYLGAMSKVQRKIYDRKSLNFIWKILSYCIIRYIKISFIWHK